MKNKYVGIGDIPYYSQKAAFLYREGSLHKLQIDEWRNNLCGLMCLSMVINKFNIVQKYTIAELLNFATKLGAFHQQRGWIHKKMALLAEKHGIKSRCQTTKNLNTIYKLLTDNNLIIASVSPNYMHPRLKATTDEQNGHLILISGMSRKETGEFQLYVSDPGSGATDGGQNLVVNSDIFERSFSGNIITFKNS